MSESKEVNPAIRLRDALTPMAHLQVMTTMSASGVFYDLEGRVMPNEAARTATSDHEARAALLATAEELMAVIDRFGLRHIKAPRILLGAEVYWPDGWLRGETALRHWCDVVLCVAERQEVPAST